MGLGGDDGNDGVVYSGNDSGGKYSASSFVSGVVRSGEDGGVDVNERAKRKKCVEDLDKSGGDKSRSVFINNYFVRCRSIRLIGEDAIVR